MTPLRWPDPMGATRRRAWLLLLPVAIILIAAAITPAWELRLHQSDIELYFDKARALGSGLLPYRDFKLEYPPLALVPMAVPYLLWPFGPISLEGYAWLFAAWEAALIVALGLVLARLVRLGVDGGAPAAGTPGPLTESGAAAGPSLAARLRRTGVRLAVLAAGAALVLTWRFDLYPALLVMAALWAALEGRPVAAGAAVGMGILAKLYPLAVVPALAVPWLVPLDPRRLASFGLAVALTVGLGVALFVALAGESAFDFLAYHSDRGLQLESLGGGLAVLGGLLAGQPVQMTFGFSSPQVEGSFAAHWLRLLPAMTAVGFGGLAVLAWRRVRREGASGAGVEPRTVAMLAFASLLVLLATSKVFSIQYVIWYLPFAALLRGRQFWLAAAVVALTMPIHPLLYGQIVNQEPLPVLLLNLRNVLFLALLATVLRDLAVTGRPVQAAARPSASVA